ncbi:MAG: glutathione S-transferase family protein [Pigmentiphaga sp.]
MHTLEIWGRCTSSNVQALMWCLAELELPSIRHDVGLHHGGNNLPAFLAMNPNGTIPVLRDGNSEPLWETGAILRYIASRYGNPVFWPEEALARAQVDKWAEWSKWNVAQFFSRFIFWPQIFVPPSQQDPAAVRRALPQLDRYLDIAEARLAQQAFLANDNFTLADIQLGHILFRYFTLNTPRQTRPALERYYADLTARPAYREHVMVDYEALRVRD